MSRRRSNVARLGTPDPVLVRYVGSDAAAPSVSYIVCINGWVPERYEVWCINRHIVCEVNLTAQVKLFTLFDENTFRSTFYDSRRCRVSFIGRKVSSLSAICTSLRTVLRTLFPLKISSFIPGEISNYDWAYLLQLYLLCICAHYLLRRFQ